MLYFLLGKDLHTFENDSFCQMVLDNNALQYASSLNFESVLPFSNYVHEHKKENWIELYRSLDDSVQGEIYKASPLELEEKINALRVSKTKTAEKILSEENIDLSTLSLDDFRAFANRKILIPQAKITSKVTHKLASIGNVNTYRFLIENLKQSNDMDNVEATRKKYYETKLAEIGEDGWLPEFKSIQDILSSGQKARFDSKEVETLKNLLGDENLLYTMLSSKNPQENLRKVNDYFISNMIIDYFLEDVPTNALKNVNTMLNYQAETKYLSPEDQSNYEMFANIDKYDVKHKLMLFEVMKGQNIDWVSKFYDDFSKGRTTMVTELNDSILNEETSQKFCNQPALEQFGVPIYVLNGEDFNCFVRNIGIPKDRPLQKSDLEFRSDGASFSVDSSKSLQVFGNNSRTYTLAYSRIPPKQLIHTFFSDSYSNYRRSYEDDIPELTDATDRILGLYTPEQLTTMGKEYNELLVSVPNFRKHNELEEQLEAPKPFAIYCYDEFSYTDIESAKSLGLGIILVNTHNYSIDKSKGISQFDTMSFGKKEREYRYLKSRDAKDDRCEI